MATVTSKGSQGAVNWSSGAMWTGDAKPSTGDTVVIADGDNVTIDENVSLAALSAAGNTGYITCAVDRTITFTGTGLSYGGSLSAGFLRQTANTLTITGPGSGSLVTNTSTGYAVVTSSTAGLSMTNSGGNVVNCTGSGRCVNYASSGSLSITGTIVCSGAGRAINLASGTSGSGKTITGNVEASAGIGISAAAGSVTFDGVPTSSVTGVAIGVSGGTVVWTGARTLGASSDCFLTISTGTLDLSNLTLTLSGVFVVQKSGAGTVTLTGAAINRQAKDAVAAGLGVDLDSVVNGPTIPPVFGGHVCRRA